jgi:hypothetical protein
MEVRDHLIASGEAAVERVAQLLSAGGGAVHLQLVASAFYETIKERLDAPLDRSERRLLEGVASQCGRAASAGLAPPLILVELRAAVAMLSGAHGPAPLRAAAPPRLRLIQGGLA